MRLTNPIASIFILSIVPLAFSARDVRSAAGDEPKQQPRIRVDEIGTKVVVLGRLNQPLRRVVTVKGKWAEPKSGAKPSNDLRFVVTEANGKKLDNPVEFLDQDVSVVKQDRKEAQPVIGETWEIRAYETWTIYDHPQEYWDELSIPPHSPLEHGSTQLKGVLKPLKKA
jgi:hypothetical protein